MNFHRYISVSAENGQAVVVSVFIRYEMILDHIFTGRNTWHDQGLRRPGTDADAVL